ncbi:hypothetical protein BO70DRAFT_34617 [Aspergillus heteromorphus CBS 117.55]|uniref:Uncharacterized protein n=1 Tax=Aspergillus heteromorphus CBS 117.55 TaxID=1448321 RepID=A0A317UQM4_9EURO|nr:hypothetical protein BO70DRAFT_34617 [Aspergillus heteromorphus CBS 117.55]
MVRLVFRPIPKFDDRFARQNRCEPPPEFPLASPYSGIVHHLSGPHIYALTQIHPKTSGSVDGAPTRGLPPPFAFTSRTGLTPEHSRRC